MQRCVECDGRLDRPGLYGCDEVSHTQPTLAQRIARVVEADIRDRRGLKGAFESIDSDTQDDIRDTWSELISSILNEFEIIRS